MIDMINFLKFHGAKIYNGKRIYLNSIPWEKVNFPLSQSEHKKAYFDIKEHRFYKISNGYLEMIREQAKEEKEQIEEWIKKQEKKAINEAELKEESAKQAVKAERLQELKARAKAKGDNIKGFHNLFLAIYEKFDFTEKEAMRKAREAINNGIDYFTLKDESLKEKIKIDIKNQKYLIESIIPLIAKQLKKIKTFDDLLCYVFTGDFLEMKKDVLSFICKSAKQTVDNAEIKAESKRSKAQKQADRKYNESDKGKEANRKYRESEKGRMTIKQYLQSENGKQARQKANRKYRESEKGQQTQKQAYNKYKDSEKGKEARLKAVRAYRERQKAKNMEA